MMYGPDEPRVAQEKLNHALNDFFQPILISKKMPELAIQKEFLDQIQSIIRGCNNPSKLSLDQTINVEQRPLSTKEILESLELLIIDEGFKIFSESFKVGYGTSAARPVPTTFKQQNNEDLIDEHEIRYQITKKLEGRGQAGLANFYSDGAHEVLIKQDDPATCVLEGTASFVNQCQLLPKTLEDCVNFASVGVISQGKDQTMVVSVQDRVAPSVKGGRVRPWDELVYGVKRNPNTISSYESWYPENIKQSIASLPPSAKWQLAASLFSCAIAGDESLHVGQFMAILDKDNNITGIKRIDLGARERYAVARSKTGQHDPYHDSTQYQAHGQWGKDYLSYLLADQSFRNIYTMLWMNLSSKDLIELKKQVKEASRATFLSQFETIPEALREETLQKVLDVFNKDATVKMTLTGASVEDKIASMADKISDIAANRMTEMLAKATNEYNATSMKEIQRFDVVKDRDLFNKLVKSSEYKQEILAGRGKDGLVKGSEFIDSFEEGIIQLLQECKSGAKSTDNFKQIQVLSEASVDLLQTMYLQVLNQTDNKNQNLEQLKTLEAMINKYQTMADITQYCLTTRSGDKIPYMVQAMEMTMKSKEEMMAYIANKNFIEHIAAHTSTIGSASSYVISSQSQGEILLRKLFKRHNMDEAPITLSRNARQLLDYTADNKMNDVALLTANKHFNVYDALIPDEKGMTALHYLMANENLNEQGLNAIVNILTKSLSRVTSYGNAVLDIPNRDGKTPLELLMQNKNAKQIIDKVNSSHIGGGLISGSYEVQHFFKVEKYDPKLIEELKGMSTPVAQTKKGGWNLWG